jgi:hypothetical protein
MCSNVSARIYRLQKTLTDLYVRCKRRIYETHNMASFALMNRKIKWAVTECRPTVLCDRGSITDRGSSLSVFHHAFQHQFEAHLASFSVRTGGSFPRIKVITE